MGRESGGEAMDKDWTLPENLAELKRLAEGATPGPWWSDYIYAVLRYAEKNSIIFQETPEGFSEPQRGDCDFIAAAREALPQLIQKVDLVRQAFEEAERELDDLRLEVRRLQITVTPEERL